MKDLAVLRGIVMMVLLLVSMYLVFSTVTDQMDTGAESAPSDDLERLNNLLEEFEVLSPQDSKEPPAEMPARQEKRETEEPSADSIQDKIRQEQDRADRERARAALAESIRNGEANRLLERVAEPLLEKQDVKVEGHLPQSEQLAESIEILLETLDASGDSGDDVQSQSAEPEKAEQEKAQP